MLTTEKFVQYAKLLANIPCADADTEEAMNYVLEKLAEEQAVCNPQAIPIEELPIYRGKPLFLVYAEYSPLFLERPARFEAVCKWIVIDNLEQLPGKWHECGHKWFVYPAKPTEEEVLRCYKVFNTRFTNLKKERGIRTC